MKKHRMRLSHTPHIIIRWAVSATKATAGAAAARNPRPTNSRAQTSAMARLVTTPAAETMMSPRLKCRYLRGLTGIGLAPPNAKAPPDTSSRMAGMMTVMIGSMCGTGFSVRRPSM